MIYIINKKKIQSKLLHTLPLNQWAPPRPCSAPPLPFCFFFFFALVAWYQLPVQNNSCTLPSRWVQPETETFTGGGLCVVCCSGWWCGWWRAADCNHEPDGCMGVRLEDTFVCVSACVCVAESEMQPESGITGPPEGIFGFASRPRTELAAENQKLRPKRKSILYFWNVHCITRRLYHFSHCLLFGALRFNDVQSTHLKQFLFAILVSSYAHC